VKQTFMLIVLFCAVTSSAMADQPGADWMSKAQVVAKLKASGYESVTKLKGDDGYWEGKGVKNGKVMEFHVDPHTGSVTKEEVDD
jgi:hypothetical protein